MNQQGSPPHKRTKNVPSESIKPSRRIHKTTYFFEPVNKLTNDHNRDQITHKDANPKSLSGGTVPSVTVPAVTGADPSFDDRVRHSDEKRQLINDILAHQSSDDSFEGIRWKASPTRTTGNRDKLPSSPLKTLTSPQHNEPTGNHSLVTVTNPVLYKYGNEFNNILSQTPSLHRTHSDVSSAETSNKRKLHQRSPTLVRAKSAGLDNLVRSKSRQHRLDSSTATKSTLNNWLNKFETNSFPKLEQHPVKSRDDESDDPFSDDDSELLAALATQKETVLKVDPTSITRDNKDPIDVSQQEVDQNLKLRASTPNTESQFSISDESINDFSTLENNHQLVNIVETAASDSDDPFSDDDSELIQILGTSKLNEASVLQTSKEIPVINYQTESLTQLKRDAAHATSFQKSIRRFEELQNKLDYQDRDQTEIQLSFKRSDLRRYQIKGFKENYYGEKLSKRQLIMDVIDSSQVPQKLIVRGEYTELEYEANDIIHVIITNPQTPKLIDDTNNLIIWNPDTLISATAVSQQLTCPRKVVLTNRFKFPGILSVPLIIGEIIHGIFQACFASDQCSMKFMLELTDKFLQEYLLSILSVEPEIQRVKDEIVKQLPYLQKWFHTYYRQPLSKNNEIGSGHKDRVYFSVNEVLEVEENIWSPMYGVKGMVDASLEVSMKNKNIDGSFLMPMEIKTGREHITHQAQASLYALLYKDRYEMDINSFLLVYSKDGVTKKCDISKQDLKSLVNLRNRITKYFKGHTRELPPLLKRTVCDNCNVQEACMTINKLDEEGTAEASGIPLEMYNEITSHLNENEAYKKFYDYWDQLLTHEESILRRALKYLWVHTAKQREEQQGMAIGGLIISNVEEKTIEERFYYTFLRERTGNDWIGSKIVKYDRVIISDELGHFNLGGGTVIAVTGNTIVVSTGKRVHTTDLKLSINEKTQSSYSKSPNGQVFKSALRNQIDYSSETTYRIDKDEFFEGMGLARYNILNLFMRNGDEKRRKMIVDLDTPRFSPSSLSYKTDPSKYNPDQIKAFDKVLTSKDYSLILGMPGTGKTTVIAQLIKYLVENKKTVFLASYTHSAVDNILIKLKGYGVNFLRIGYIQRVHPEIQLYVPGSKISTYEEFCETYLTPPVVASTCLGIGDVAFNLRPNFDYCIIDEASQVSMPISLGPLRFCNKFILVGDHLQLPPLVQHPNPKIKAGLSRSLFKILAEAHPESLVELTYQYRMCYEIMQLSNILIYQNRLKCGSKEVAEQSLRIPNPQKLNQFLPTPMSQDSNSLWLHKALEEKNKVLFLNHDNLPGLERSIGERVDNLVEAELIRQLVEGLTLCGVEQSSVGVMSFNRAQLRLLHRKLWDKKDLEILTADQYQGRDKDCIIISLVRSNREKKAGDLVQEWRRINVAITRAKSKLIILGSKSTLSSADSIRTFIELLNDRGWIYDLEPNANLIYDFPEKVSQVVKKSPERGSRLVGNGVLRDIVNNMS